MPRRHAGRLVLHGDTQAPARLGGGSRHRGEGLCEVLPDVAKGSVRVSIASRTSSAATVLQ
jgi:hypothetical protein